MKSDFYNIIIITAIISCCAPRASQLLHHTLAIIVKSLLKSIWLRIFVILKNRMCGLRFLSPGSVLWDRIHSLARQVQSLWQGLEKVESKIIRWKCHFEIFSTPTLLRTYRIRHVYCRRVWHIPVNSQGHSRLSLYDPCKVLGIWVCSILALLLYLSALFRIGRALERMAYERSVRILCNVESSKNSCWIFFLISKIPWLLLTEIRKGWKKNGRMKFNWIWFCLKGGH